MKNKNRNVVVYKKYFWEFYYSQSLKVQTKIDWTIGLIKELEIIPKHLLASIKGTNGLWEIRLSFESNSYRIFCFFDKGNIVILLSAFQKKTQKLPIKEIRKAQKLKREYLNERAK